MSYRHFLCRPAPEKGFEKVTAHAAMQFAYAIDGAAAMDGKIGHVKGFGRLMRILPPQRQQVRYRNMQLVGSVVSEVPGHQSRIEMVEACRHRRMGGKDISRPGYGERFFKRLPRFLHLATSSFQHGKSRMSFVEMAYF